MDEAPLTVHHGHMSDDIERLLAQVNQTTGSAPSPATKASPPARRDDKPGGRVAFAVVAAVVLGLVTWLIGVILPFVGAINMGVGGAVGAFVAALIAGPPRWFSS